MIDSTDLLSLAATSRSSTTAEFIPTLYAIAIKENPEILISRQNNILIGAHAFQDGRLDVINSLMVWHHELIHAAQFLSSNFGLAALYFQISLAQQILAEKKPIHWPMIGPAHRTDLWKEDAALYFYYYYATQMHPMVGHYSPRGAAILLSDAENLHACDPASLFDRHYVFAGGLDLVSLIRPVANIPFYNTVIFNKINRPPLAEYIGLRPDGDDFEVTAFNAGALFEANALLGELMFIKRFGKMDEDLTGSEIEQYVQRKGAPYDTALHAFQYLYGLGTQSIIERLAAIIDICLMYDSVIMHDIPPKAGSGFGRPYRSAVDVFWDACEAAREMPLPKDLVASAPEIFQKARYGAEQVYQDELCRRMGLPLVSEMTKQGIRWLEECAPDLFRSPKEGPVAIDLGLPLRLHATALKLRSSVKCGYFVYQLRPGRNSDIAMMLYQAGALFDPDTGLRWKCDSEQPSRARNTIGSVLLRIIREGDFRCPFREGKPFHCLDEPLPPGTWCSGTLDKGQRITLCPFVHFHEKFWNPPALS